MGKSMKRLLICLIAIILLLMVSVPVVADNAPRFYAKGLDYEAQDNLTRVEGRINTVRAEATKWGMAGIELDVRIKTEIGTMTVEITSWFYREGLVQVGTVVYKDGQRHCVRRAKAEMREAYSYELVIDDGCVWTDIRDSEGKTLKKATYHEYCGALYIDNVTTYIEYWRLDAPGSFFYYGYVTVDDVEQLQFREDLYHKSKGLDFNFYLIHHNWGGIVDKGEIDDR